jgi:hypothetical protein
MSLKILDSQQVLTTLHQHQEIIRKLGVHSLALFGLNFCLSTVITYGDKNLPQNHISRHLTNDDNNTVD